MNYIHRFAGRLLTIAANIHVLGYGAYSVFRLQDVAADCSEVYKWTNSGDFVRHISEPRYAWGLVAIVCIDVLFFFSLAIWRLRAHNVFYLSHIAASILFLVAVCLLLPSSLRT